MKPYLIINPTAAYGKMRERWRTIEPVLREENFAFDCVFTEYHLHAIELTRAAVRAGYDLIVSVGGDGTLNEVVNGLFDAEGTPINPNVQVGVIPSGTGGDFFRTAQIPRDPIVAARQLVRT
ncbi:MAG: acylglycerol kinase family protein, partial [Anaerolineae bacterium]|nr:acylglycerol kinase family protein [Anaerolineae bacterium]